MLEILELDIGILFLNDAYDPVIKSTMIKKTMVTITPFKGDKSVNSQNINFISLSMFVLIFYSLKPCFWGMLVYILYCPGCRFLGHETSLGGDTGEVFPKETDLKKIVIDSLKSHELGRKSKTCSGRIGRPCSRYGKVAFLAGIGMSLLA